MLSQAYLTSTPTVPQFASMSEVVMKKQELLTRLIENKAKHDVVLSTAVSGYWDLASMKLGDKKKKLKAQISEWQSDVERELQKLDKKVEEKEKLPDQVTMSRVTFDCHLGLVFPQDHSRDYDRAISMMQSSVFDEVRLSCEEYDAYVLNNWEWKQNFLDANAGYFNTMRSRQSVFGKRADAPCLTGCYVSQYNTANDIAVSSFMASGLSVF
jgi:hypothetical protein